jgi:hypothetical protein
MHPESAISAEWQGMNLLHDWSRDSGAGRTLWYGCVPHRDLGLACYDSFTAPVFRAVNLRVRWRAIDTSLCRIQYHRPLFGLATDLPVVFRERGRRWKSQR